MENHLEEIIQFDWVRIKKFQHVQFWFTWWLKEFYPIKQLPQQSIF